MFCFSHSKCVHANFFNNNFGVRTIRVWSKWTAIPLPSNRSPNPDIGELPLARYAATALRALSHLARQVRHRQSFSFSYFLCLAFHHRLPRVQQRRRESKTLRLLFPVRSVNVFYILQYLVWFLVFKNVSFNQKIPWRWPGGGQEGLRRPGTTRRKTFYRRRARRPATKYEL